MNTTKLQAIQPPSREPEAREWFHNRRRGMMCRRATRALVRWNGGAK